MKSDSSLEPISYDELVDELFSKMDDSVEENADLYRRAHKLSVKKEVERINHLEMIQEKDIEIRKLQDSYNLIVTSKWWKLVSPLRKAYEKMQKVRGQKTLTDTLSEIQDSSRYERIDYQAQREVIWKNSLREFADGEQSVQKIVSKEYKEGQLYDVVVSVIIPTFNAGSEIRELFASLKGQVGIRKVEIIVVDSGSEDETLNECAFAGVKPIQIRNEEFSHSYARNLGADHASGDYLLFMTQDALPEDKSFIYRLLSVIIDGKASAASPCEIDNGKGDLKYKADCYNHCKYLGLDRGDKLTMFEDGMGAHDVRKSAQLTDVANIISKELFMKYRFEGDYAEDLRLGLRLIKDGYTLAQLTSVRVRHAHNRSAEYIMKRTYTDQMALCELFPDLLLSGFETGQILDYIKRGDEQIKTAMKNMNQALEYKDNIIVYGRTLEHGIMQVQDCGNAVPFLNAVKVYIHNGLMPYVADQTAYISKELHEEILDTIYKAYAFEVGTQIAYHDMHYGKNEDLSKVLADLKV